MGALSIFRGNIDLEAYHQKYLEYIHQTSLSDSFESHYHAAFYAPVLFLKGAKDFEGTFNQILFHLENAYDKAETESARRGVSGTMQWLVDFHVEAIETGMEIIASDLEKNWFTRKWESIQGIISEVFLESPNGGTIVIEIGRLLNEYHVYLTNKKTIEKYKIKFYPQLLHVFSKVVNSKIYSSDHKLVVHSFIGVKNKQSLFSHAIQEKGLAITLNMLRQFDMPKGDFGESLRILVKNLAIVSPIPTAEDLMRLIDFFREEDIPNRDDLERDTVRFYQYSVIPIALREHGLADTLETLGKSSLSKKDVGYSLRMIISSLDTQRVTEVNLMAIMKFANEKRLLNQEEIRRDLIDRYKKVFAPKVPDLSIPISIGLIASFFIWILLLALTANKVTAVTFLLLSICAAIFVTPITTIYHEKKFNRGVRKFSEKLNQIITTDVNRTANV